MKEWHQVLTLLIAIVGVTLFLDLFSTPSWVTLGTVLFIGWEWRAATAAFVRWVRSDNAASYREPDEPPDGGHAA